MRTKCPFRITAPGRVCLFGEHSDYLGLEVITASIDRTIRMYCSPPRTDRTVSVEYSDLGEHDMFSLDEPLAYRHRRDYLRSAFNVLGREGISPANGADIRVDGDIPLAGGLSGSSALAVASVMTVAAMAGAEIKPRRIGELAFKAEVAEFGESGGMMDHFASAFGGMIHVDCATDSVTRLACPISSMVIGDSLEKKADTVGDLVRIRTAVEKGYAEMKKAHPEFDNKCTPLSVLYETSAPASDKNWRMARSTIENRDLTREAFRFLLQPHPDPVTLGKLIDRHHAILRNNLRRSTGKIERMIHAAKDAGALGCKINGSGGGGTMLAYAPSREASVMRAIGEAGGVPHLVTVGQGAHLTILRE
jgi:galactokinase